MPLPNGCLGGCGAKLHVVMPPAEVTAFEAALTAEQRLLAASARKPKGANRRCGSPAATPVRLSRHKTPDVRGARRGR